ncbi:TetR/AcrR family transcriptional regulator [Brachybacterium sp. FME24]|uniref:TetR/AcrR family transcriptional regulator n=1 Tax=Brachybacterium sp. FME24 TaxID=2742605 RepID=UPI001868A871|nr:TetR/AcrR family transcriptional regulator [Brachybacterium sp. FME24]
MEPADDLTSRARIRHTALEQFASSGYRATTLRGIAARANTSLGVVQHHFGSKEGLRAACDAYVAEFIQEQIARSTDLDQLADPAVTGELYGRAPAVLRYLGRALADGSPAMTPLFDGFVAAAEERLVERGDSEDPRGVAAVLVAMRLGVFTLNEHIARAFEAPALTPESMRRIAAALLQIVDPELLGPASHHSAREGLDGARDHHDERRQGGTP